MVYEVSPGKFLQDLDCYIKSIQHKHLRERSIGTGYIKYPGARRVQVKQEDLLLFWEIDKKEKEEIAVQTRQSYAGLNYYGSSISPRTGDLWAEMEYRDMHTEGTVWNFPHGNVIMQGVRGHYFRGESTIYPTSTSSLSRNLQEISPEQRVYEIILARLRIIEYGNLLNQIPFIKEWPEKYLGTVWVEAIAQHYGFPTFFLDITNDFATAMLFATCQYNSRRKKWEPLPLRNMYRHQYGVIYHATQDEMERRIVREYEKRTSTNDFLHNMIYPIGFQPLNRCSNQYGFVMYMPEDVKSLEKSTLFERIVFRQSEKLSNDVLERTEEGKNIFPDEEVALLESYQDHIKNSYCISNVAWETLCNQNPKIESMRNNFECYIATKYKQNIFWKKEEVPLPKERIQCIDEEFRKTSPFTKKPVRLMCRCYSPSRVQQNDCC